MTALARSIHPSFPTFCDHPPFNPLDFQHSAEKITQVILDAIHQKKENCSFYLNFRATDLTTTESSSSVVSRIQEELFKYVSLTLQQEHLSGKRPLFKFNIRDVQLTSPKHFRICLFKIVFEQVQNQSDLSPLNIGQRALSELIKKSRWNLNNPDLSQLCTVLCSHSKKELVDCWNNCQGTEQELSAYKEWKAAQLYHQIASFLDQLHITSAYTQFKKCFDLGVMANTCLSNDFETSTRELGLQIFNDQFKAGLTLKHTLFGCLQVEFSSDFIRDCFIYLASQPALPITHLKDKIESIWTLAVETHLNDFFRQSIKHQRLRAFFGEETYARMVDTRTREQAALLYSRIMNLE